MVGTLSLKVDLKKAQITVKGKPWQEKDPQVAKL